jgi:hypothetical protein
MLAVVHDHQLFMCLHVNAYTTEARRSACTIQYEYIADEFTVAVVQDANLHSQTAVILLSLYHVHTCTCQCL